MLSAEKMIQGLPYEQQAVMYKLRELILKVDPKIVETVKWGSPVYSRGRNLLSIVPQEKHVHLQIWDGAALCDRFPLIEADGQSQNMRHVKVKYKGRNDFKTIEAIIGAVLSPPRPA